MAIVNGVKISQLNQATTLELDDLLALSRGNKTFKIAANDIIKKVTATQKFEQIIGNGTRRNFTITHNLNTLLVTVVVREVATGEVVYPDIELTTANTTVIRFKSAPAASSYQVLITKV